MATKRQVTFDQQLRAKALSTARIQFSGYSPQDLTRAAEELYQWMKHGPRAPTPLDPQERFNLELRALLDQGYEPFEALTMLRGQPTPLAALALQP